MTLRKKIRYSLISLLVLFVLIMINAMLGKNDDQNWQVLQYPGGSVQVINHPGYYLTWFGKVTTYPRNWQVEYHSSKDEDWSTKVTFNDGGWAHMDSIIRFSSPSDTDKQRQFHRLFAGCEKNVESAVWAHLSDAMKSSGPMMSTSEHQSARRSEYNSLVQEQLEKGLYEMKRVERLLLDQTDDKGKPITVYATEVILKDGRPVVNRESPLSDIGIKISQFSITDVRYDEQTVKQFVTKKDAFLAAENSKAQREKEVQERLMVTEKGLREKAEAEASALKEKATQVINAQREKEVAELNAARELAVAEMTKRQAEVKAEQELMMAKLAKETAQELSSATITKAKADKERLQLAGDISEKERILAEIECQRSIGVARELSKISSPSVVIIGGDNGDGGDMKDQLLNVFLLKQMDLLKK